VPRNDRGGAVATFFIVIASEAWQSRDIGLLRHVVPRNDRGGAIASLFHLSLRAKRGNLGISDCFGTSCLAMIRMLNNVVRGFSLVRTTLKGRTTKGDCASQRQNNKREGGLNAPLLSY
jgi:hypothetical protein